MRNIVILLLLTCLFALRKTVWHPPWVWFRKSDKVPSWLGFFATIMGVLVLVNLPAMIAAYFPVLAAMDNFATQ